jgi:hypothetical protein
MAANVNHQWLLAARPSGAIKESDFKWHEAPIPEPGQGEVLIRTIYVSLDPTMRGWMEDRPSYLPPVAIGEPMRAGGVGEVVKSNHPGYPVGMVVSGMTNWQEYAISDGTGIFAMRPVPKGMPLPLSMSLFATTGMTAYFGLLDLGQPKPGETVVVSGAAGATGSIAGQIAKIKGCRVVGLAGTDEKCAWVRDDLGFDACMNYKTENVAHRLHELCPNGIDVYFDNVGGVILNTVLTQINMKARVVLCGGISSYNATEPPPGPSNYMQLVIKRARMEGFIVIDYMARFPEAAVELGTWLAEGKLKSKEDIVEGLENAPRALRSLFEGANTGKLLVKVGREP